MNNQDSDVNRSAEKEAGGRNALNLQIALEPKDWLLSGGGGFEDGIDGLRASTFSAFGLIDMLRAYREYLQDFQDARATSVGVEQCPPAQLPNSSGSSGGGSDGGAGFGEPRGVGANTREGQMALKEWTWNVINKGLSNIWCEFELLACCSTLEAQKICELHNSVIKATGRKTALEQSFANEDAANLATIAHIPDDKLRAELATSNAEIEYCHRLLDEHYGLAGDGMTSLDPLDDRLKRLLSSHAPESSRDSSSPKTARSLDNGGAA